MNAQRSYVHLEINRKLVDAHLLVVSLKVLVVHASPAGHKLGKKSAEQHLRFCWTIHAPPQLDVTKDLTPIVRVIVET